MSWPSVQPRPGRMITSSERGLQNLRLFTRAYSTASASVSRSPGKRKSPSSEESSDKEGKNVVPPKRSELSPPKQAPSVWQIFFTDWLAREKSHDSADRRLNVAQAAKEAGQLYNKLSEEERNELKQRALILKEQYDRALAAWKRTLRPSDVDRENEFRAAQRKSGKSRLRNIIDPNAPKRPLGAYFMFLQTIRSNPQMVKEVFDDVTEATRQSVLAASKWKSMSDAEKRPYFDQAEHAKLEYEAARKVYEEQIRSNEYTVTSVVVYPASYSTPLVSRQDSDGDGGASTSGSRN